MEGEGSGPGHPQTAFETLRQRALDAMGMNDMAAVQQAADELSTLHTPEANAIYTFALGSLAAIQGDMPNALERFNTARELLRAVGDETNSAQATINIGMAHLHLGDLPEAFALLNEAVGLAEHLEDPQMAARARNGIGSVYRLTGDYPKAAEVYHQALDTYEKLELWFSAGMIHGNLGGVYRPMDEPQRALDCYRRALELFERSDAAFATTQTLGAIGQTLADLGDFDESEKYYQQAIELAQRMRYTAEEARWSIYLASHLCGFGRHDVARVIVAKLDYSQFSDPHIIALHDLITGELHEHAGELESARTEYEHALSVAQSMGSPHLSSDAHDALRSVAHKRNDIEMYIKHSEEYHRLQEELKGKDAAVRLTMLEKQREIEDLERKHQRHLDILYSTLPKNVADRVARGEVVNDVHPSAAVLFMDIAGFTTQSSTMDPQATTTLLAEIFESFDEICERYDVTKIKTIGDSYMAVAFDIADVVGARHRLAREQTGIANQIANSEQRIANVAQAMMSCVFTWPHTEDRVMFRIGIHCGPVVAGVIGTQRLQYDVWGDTVNVASRMESTSEPGKIHVSSSFALAVQSEETKGRNGHINLLERGSVDVKGKGMMKTYWLLMK